MGKKCKCPPPGAPEWVLTYGDMMSLLLCFFILLAALSELKKEDKNSAAQEDIKLNKGMASGSAPKISGMHLPGATMISQLNSNPNTDQSATDPDVRDPSSQGEHRQVQSLRQEQIYTVNARVIFAPGSAQLNDEGRAALVALAKKVQGLTNKIEIRGHASRGEKGMSAAHPDLWALSFSRARVVMTFLASSPQNIEESRLKLIAVGDTDPLVVRRYSSDDQADNRRTDILMSNHLTSDPIPGNDENH